MAPRAVASGTLSFGLVNIPVKLHSAANPSAGVSFKLLSKEGHKLKQQYVDPSHDNAVVERRDMVKGYEVGKDRYVLFTEEELKELQERATQSVDIEEFIREEDVPREYFQKTYYLSPDKGGDRAYALLSRAMTETGRVGLGRYATRGKQYLVLVAPKDDGLALHQLHYADELASFDEVPRSTIDVKDTELAMAIQLIHQISNDRFEPDKYEDEVRKRIELAIQHKRDGQEIPVDSPGQPEGKIIDLMDALKASLGVGGGGSASAKGAEADASDPEQSAQDG